MFKITNIQIIFINSLKLKFTIGGHVWDNEPHLSFAFLMFLLLAISLVSDQCR